MRDDVHVRCEGRWPSILMALGLSPEFLKNKHGPCPMCGGKTRFRINYSWTNSASFFHPTIKELLNGPSIGPLVEGHATFD